MKIYTSDEFMKNDLHVHVFRCESVEAIPLQNFHSHEFIEIVYILSGKMKHRINHREYSVKGGRRAFYDPRVHP